MRLRRAPVVVKLGEPIATEGFAYEDRTALRERSYEAVARLRTAARARLRELGAEPGGTD